MPTGRLCPRGACWPQVWVSGTTATDAEGRVVGGADPAAQVSGETVRATLERLGVGWRYGRRRQTSRGREAPRLPLRAPKERSGSASDRWANCLPCHEQVFTGRAANG